VIEANNLVTLTGGLTRDPQLVNDSIVKMSVAIDWATNAKDGKPSGYFDVTYYLSGGDQRNSDFVRGQINQGNMRKGSQISLVGRLCQDRWTDGDQNRQKVVVVAENIRYAKSGTPQKETVAAAGEATVLPDF